MVTATPTRVLTPPVTTPDPPLPPTPPPTVRRLFGEQALVIGAQALAGLGNFAFLLAALRLVSSRGFAQLATFLALYLVVLMPLLGLSAGASASPGAGRRAARRTAVIGGVVAVVVAAAAPALALPLHVSAWMLVVLALALPGAAPLALVRGRLYGECRSLAISASLAAEPVARFAVGLALLSVIGPLGGAIGVVAGGYAALAVGLVATRGRSDSRGGSDSRGRSDAGHRGEPSAKLPGVTVAAFVLLAVAQNQDVVLANGLLPAGAAGTFAALSTLGGVAAFATATVPLVLLPRAIDHGRDGRRATQVAVALAVVVAVVATLVAAVTPRSVYAAVLGERYAGAAPLAGLYLAAMGLLGIARVQAARLVARGRARLVVALTAVAVVVQSTSIVLALRNATGVAAGTLLATIVLTGGLTAAPRLPLPAVSWAAVRRLAWVRTTPAVLGSLTVGAIVVRLYITRGLWLDEATSVTQARMPYTQMLHSLRTTDVHPPGYFTLLWGWVRVFGAGPLSVRMPSILLAAAVVPALYFCGRELYGRRTALIAAGFGVIAPQLVWYGQEARMYAPFMLLVTLSVGVQARALRTGDRRWWVAHGAVCAAMFATQYFTVLVIATQQVVTAVLLLKQWRRGEPVRRQLTGWGAALAALVLLVLPLVPFALAQFSANQASGRGFGAPTATNNGIVQPGTTMSPYVVIANLLWAVWGYHSKTVMTDLGALWPAGMLLVLALLGRGRSRATLLTLAVALVPVTVMYLVGIEKRFLFDLRYFIGCVPMLVLVAARAAATWPRTRHGSAVLAGLVGLSFLVGLGDQQLNGENPRRYDFAPALHRIAGHAAPQDEVVLAPYFLRDVSSYYEPRLRTVGAQGDLTAVVAHTANDPHVFVLGSFFENGGAAETSALVKQLRQHRRLIARWTLANVKVWEFQ